MTFKKAQAKHKLLLVGDGPTLETAYIIKAFFEVVGSEGWRQMLPAGAHELRPPPAGRQ